ncbi:MAG: hypothetical protein LQ337_006757, partial [Flavoplaca oasis]
MSDAGFPSTATGNTSNPPRFTALPPEVLFAMALLILHLHLSQWISQQARSAVQEIHEDDRIVELDEEDSLNTIAQNKQEATPSPKPFSQDIDSEPIIHVPSPSQACDRKPMASQLEGPIIERLHPPQSDQKPMANPFNGPIIERPHPPICHRANDSPFYMPRSASDDRKRCRGKKVAAPLPLPSPSSGRRLVPSTSRRHVETEPEVPTASGDRRHMHALHSYCTTESEASSSTTRGRSVTNL